MSIVRWVCCILFTGFTGTGMAQTLQPVRLIVPFATGGPTDIGARIVAPYLAGLLKRPVIVENKPGATGAIGIKQVARAVPDGATILLGSSSSMGSSPAVFADLPYDVFKDFVPVGTIATNEVVLVVHPSVPANDVQEFVAYAKVNPGKIAYGTSGIGSTFHLGSELFALQTKTVFSHVPYKGAGPAAQDLVAGHIQMMMEALSTAAPNIRAGKVKALGITSLRRNPQFPAVPTLAEQGVMGCDYAQWIALFLPAGTARTIVEKLNADLNAVLAEREVSDKFVKLGMQTAPGTPDQLASRVHADILRWSRVVRLANIKAE
ncbi:MAG TPA: tripartite tricarboxylate transporter substrate binding protein [Burkholderiales bacterium]|nr:tripartite tricarboxylate transporter substrate binding protein [Burkholderiales bacterium]